MNRALEVVSRIEELGGYLALDADGDIRYRVPKDSQEAQALLETVKTEKQALLVYLQTRQSAKSLAAPAEASQVISDLGTDNISDSDPYARRMRAALRQINLPDYPAGMVPWLDTARPDLYQELTVHLPDEIQRLWSGRGPLEQFESVLARLISLHRRCCEMHRAESTR